MGLFEGFSFLRLSKNFSILCVHLSDIFLFHGKLILFSYYILKMIFEMNKRPIQQHSHVNSKIRILFYQVSFFRTCLNFKNRKFSLKLGFKYKIFLFVINILLSKHKSLKGMSSSLPHIGKSTITLTHDDFTAMKIRANLIDVANIKESKDFELYQISRGRTSKWSDNYRDLKRRKQEERYRKFEREQLEKRKIDLEEKKFKKKWKEQQIVKANAKLFQDREQIRALNSQLLCSETMRQREEQIQMKKQQREFEKKKEIAYHRSLLKQLQLQDLSVKNAKQQQNRKLRQFRKQLKKQNREATKYCIKKIKDEMEEGALLKKIVREQIQQQQEAERLRRIRKIQNNRQIKEINQKNKKLREKQIEKQKQEQAKIEQFRKNKEIIEDLNKKQEKQLINIKIRERQQLYKLRVQHLSTVQDKSSQLFTKQIQQINKKKRQIEQKALQQRQRLEEDFLNSLREQFQKNQEEKEKIKEENENFRKQLSKQLKSLKQKENDYENFRRLKIKQNQKILKSQIQEKRMKREQNYLRELEECERVKATQQKQTQEFRNYAEKCCKEWASQGKNLYPMQKLISSKIRN